MSSPKLYLQYKSDRVPLCLKCFCSFSSELKQAVRHTQALSSSAAFELNYEQNYGSSSELIHVADPGSSPGLSPAFNALLLAVLMYH